MTRNVTAEEAKIDLNNIRLELEAMRRIQHDADWLSKREDVDAMYYSNVSLKQTGNIASGERVEKRILELYPELL